ncbi:MAG: tetratricopeptide repeat protein [Sorangiineae bacterium]|nr:tetratricopeptide repeat protein [Polyangiaceae bacterium]MEB2322698.1 tetratricopeptide repeat protein [Sorangiineae bacterium]
MDSQKIREALGHLQEDPDSSDGWKSLKAEIAAPGGDLTPSDLLRLLSAARHEHQQRGEWDAVAALLELEAERAAGTEAEGALLAELARVLEAELLDEDEAGVAWLRLLELHPDDATAEAALQESEGKRERWRELVSTYAGEAEQAPDDVYRSSMLMRAAEMELRFGSGDAELGTIVDRLEQAARLDPANDRAGRMLERIFRKASRWEDAARVLERMADRSATPELRVEAGVRLARLCRHQLDEPARAAAAFERVLADKPAHPEAMSFLSEYYSRMERWDDLVAFYEKNLSNQGTPDAERLGDMLQIAMLHFRMRGKPQDAEPWFERIAKIEPTHPGMLSFYREYSGELGDDARLIEVLQRAQRAMKDGAERAALGAELAKLMEGQENAQKAIEQYKTVLRQDPDNAEARASLKRLYTQTQGYNALVELLRQELDRTPVEQYEARLGILREVATVYRQFIKSETALVTVLNQIVQLDEKLDENDIVEVRELAQLYEKLGRWRELLTTQLKLADLSSDTDEKQALYRAVARRWLEQFSNVQNATEAYEALLGVAPGDREARDRLEELYRKRRAWPQLYELFERELTGAEGSERLTLLREMAQLAAERLNRGADAVRLYREILEADPSRDDVLDALERHAERSRDHAALAEVLERRVTRAADDEARLGVLQKLGSVYGDHLGDPVAAAGAWRRVLELSPGHQRALRVLRDAYLASGELAALEELYGSQNDWEGLADVFSTAADRAKDATSKIELSYRAAAIYEERLAQPDRAFRSYERILAAEPTDARAARALIPLYERDEKWARLPALYEVLLAQAEDEGQQLALLGKLAEVTGARLGDRRAAAGYARRAYELSPSSELALAAFEEASRAAGDWEPYVQALEARLSAEPAPAPAPEAAAEGGGKKKGRKKKKVEETAPTADSDTRPIELALARVYADELGRPEQAVAAYRRLLERDPSDAAAGQALEALLRRDDRRDELRWLLGLRVEHTVGDSERVQILQSWADLEEDVFEAPERAADLYRRVLELAPSDPAAVAALPRLLLAAGDAAGAAKVLEQHRGAGEGEAGAEREVKLAELYLDQLGRPADALGAAVRALELSAGEPRAMSVLERLLELPDTRADAARVLAERYASGGEARREANALRALLEVSRDESERIRLFSRLADVEEEKLGAFGSALDAILAAASEYPAETALWDRADSLAMLAGRPTDLAEAFRLALLHELPEGVQAELCERAARLHEDRLGDPLGATPYLEKALKLDPGNERVFARLKDIFTAAERWSELEALYDRASLATEDLSRRIDMLVEVALICEEIIEEPAKATRYYERILELDPMHDVAIRALDRLYARQGRHLELAALLERRLDTVVGDELLEHKLRLAHLRLEELHEPAKAVDYVEDVLRERPNDHEARQLAERLLEVGSIRARVARALEVVYEARDEIRELVRVLGIRLEELDAERAPAPEGSSATRDDERRELLRRIALLRDERLHDDAAAFDALARLVPLDALDSDARERLVEVGRRIGAHERVATVLTAAAEAADTSGLKGEILMQVARMQEDLLDDTAAAEATYRKIAALDDTDADLVLPAARALERIYSGHGAHQQLAETLRTQVRLEQDGAARRDLLGRLGELCESQLGDLEGAIDAWRVRVEDDPTDEAALGSLDRLYERSGRWRDLVQILERRRELLDDASGRRAFMVRAAEVLASQLGSVPEAIEAWRAVLDEFGPEPAALGAIEALYARAERWSDLGDSYQQHLDIVEDDAARLELLAHLGDVQRAHLGDLPGALETYRRALTIDTGHGPSRDAVDALLASEDLPSRREAAQILRPIYEAESAHEPLLKVLEIDIQASDDSLTRLELLETALRVAEGPLGDAGRAFGYAERAMREAVGHAELEPWLEHLERLAAATGRHAELVKLLAEVAPNIFDGEVQLAVMLKIADVARRKLADPQLAREYYQKALELRSDDATALLALEALYEEAGDAQHLLEILERRADLSEDDGEKRQLLFRRARLLADVLDDKARSIEVYETILELGLDVTAIEALEKLYTSEGRWVDLVDLHQRQLDADETPSLHVKIAEVAARRQQDLPRAFDELERALELDRQHDGAIAELERLLSEAPDAESRARAATLLEPVYLLRADFSKVMACLQARLDFAPDPDERHELLRRLAQLHEEQREDYVSALDTVAKLLHEDLADEDTISELERLAKVAGADQRLAQIYAAELEQVSGDDPVTARLARRTGELYSQLDDGERALGFYRRALAFEPDDRHLFDAIDAILSRLRRHEERVALYRDALEHRFEPAERLQHLHVIAELEETKLERIDEAIETYRSALDVDEGDAQALDALTRLYETRERWDDLAELHLRRAEQAPSAGAAAAHRLALARLLTGRLGDTERAIDQLDEIVRSTPGSSEAVKELEGLLRDDAHKERIVEILRPIYEAADDWRHLIKLNEERFALAEGEADKVLVLRETARLWEERASDPGRAQRALEAAFELDPEDAEVRGELERLVESTGDYGTLARAYEGALAARPELVNKRDLLAALARVHDLHRDDPRRALEAYAELHEVDPSDLAPLEKMERLATLLSDWPMVVRALTAKVDLLLSDEERAGVWRRVGEAKRDMLEDRAGAIAAYERAAELEPGNSFTIDCLIELRESAGEAEPLVELYERRVELCGEGDEDLTYQLLSDAAAVYETKLTDRPRAIDALSRALAAKPGDRAVLSSLGRLYRAEEMWPELLESLRLEASAAESVEERTRLRKEMAALLGEQMESHEEALEVYRLVLEEAPEDREVVDAVRAIGRAHDQLREAVAATLVPVLRATSQDEALVDVLELRLTAENEPGQRAETLRNIAEVLETRLARPADAQNSLLRALAERPELRELHGDIERLAEASGGWGRYADALGERAQSTFDPEIGKDLYTRLGRIAEERLSDRQRAVEAYSKALEQAGDQPELLLALDRLYGALGEHQALADILERRLSVEPSDAGQAELHFRLAELQLGEFKELPRGLASLRATLERQPDHAGAIAALEQLTSERDLFEEAAEILEGVYRALNRTDRLAALYEKRVGFAETPGERIDMRRSLARVLEEECSDPAAALRVLLQGLADDPADGALLDELERLAPITDGWQSAADALGGALRDAKELTPELARELWVRLATWRRDKLGDSAGAETALHEALEQGPNADEVLVLIEQLQSTRGRERDLVVTLRRRAGLELDLERREELYRRAKALADGLDDRELGEAVLRELLKDDDANIWALAELTTMREAAGDYAETLTLLVRRSELRAQGDVVRELRRKAAVIARDKLGDPARATELYEQLFEDDPTDADAADALRALYTALERHRELATLLGRLIDMAESPASRSTLRMELARVEVERFKATDAAVELLRAVLEEEPSRAEAVIALGEILEQAGRDEELAELLDAQIASARARGDIDDELAFQVRLGSLYDTRLGERDKAIATYQAVLARDPQHRGALEALRRLFQAAGRHADAAAAIERLLELSTGGEAVTLAIELADEFGQLHDTDSAIRALERGLGVEGDDAELRGRLRGLYRSKEDWERLAALIAGDAELEAQPEQKVALLVEAATIHVEKRHDAGAAATLFDAAVALRPGDRELMLKLCDAYSASGRGKAAVEVLEKIVDSYGGKRSKELAEIHRRLAEAFLADGATERALEELDKAFRIEPGNVGVLKRLGEIALDTGDLKKAQQMFRALLLQKLDDSSVITKAEVFMNLGEVHARLGEKDKAVQMLERAVQTDAGLERARARLAELKG